MMHLKRIARALRGRPSRPVGEKRVRGVSTDTRTLRPGDLFFALHGPTFDGHGFLEIETPHLTKAALSEIILDRVRELFAEGKRKVRRLSGGAS